MANLSLREKTLIRSPVTEAWANQDLCTDDGIPFNEFATPGDRIIDCHPDHIVYDVTLPPKGKASEVTKFRAVRKEALEESFAVASTSPDQIALVCDAFKPPLPLQAVAAWHAWRFGGDVHKKWHAGGLGTSDDVELLAMSEAVAWTGDLLPQLAEVHIYSDSLKAIRWLFDASNHSSMECSLAALWAIQPWLDGAPDTKVVLHHIHKDVGLDAHSLVHLYATSTQVEAGSAPWRTFDSARAASTAAMLADWNLLLRDAKYTGHNFLHLRFGGSPVTPSHIGGGPWLRGVQHSNHLTARLTRACTGHVPIGEYAARFHKESSRCMCSHPHESVIHIIHLCPLHMRSPSPGKRYQLVEFVKFLKKNPRAFEWLGADLPQSDGGGTPSGGGEVTGVPTNLRRRAKLPIGSAGGAPPAGAYPPPQPRAGATFRMHQFPGAHATVLQYRRPSKPRVRWEDPNKSNIRLFFF